MLTKILYVLFSLLIIALILYGLYKSVVILLKRRLESQLNVIRKNTLIETQVKNINNIGFEYQDGSKYRKIKFKEISSVQIKNSKLISIIVKDKYQYKINVNQIQNLNILKNIPKSILAEDRQIIETLSQELEGCEVCGLKSKMKGNCLNCTYSIEYENEFIGKESRLEFIKKEQLDHFSVNINIPLIENIVISNKKHKIFESANNWKIMFTQKELDEENSALDN